MAEQQIYISRMLADLKASMDSMQSSMETVARDIVVVAQNTGQLVQSLKVQASDTVQARNTRAATGISLSINGATSVKHYSMPLSFKSLCDGTIRVKMSATLPTGISTWGFLVLDVAGTKYEGSKGAASATWTVNVAYNDVIAVGMGCTCSPDLSTTYRNGSIAVGAVQVCYDLVTTVSDGGILPV